MKFDSNAERRAYWQAVHDTYPSEKIAAADAAGVRACAAAALTVTRVLPQV
jgi:hypothetical protein